MAPDWKNCRVGADCEVCYGDDPQVGCIPVRFRGSGPDIGRADYTAAWWARTCERDELPATLARECRRIRDAATSLQAKQSCLADPTSAGCAGVTPGADAVAAAREAVRACLQSSGDSWRCYYKGTGGTLSQGTCRNGAVTESGWDCCTGDPVHDACVTGCKGFYR